MNLAGEFFTRLTGDQQRALRAQAVVRRLPRGTKLYHQGDSVHEVFVVTQGCVKLTVVGPDGRGALVEVRGPDDLIGAADVFHGLERPMNAYALTRSTEVLALNRRSFEEFVRSDSSFNAAVLHELAQRFRRTVPRQFELAVDDVHGRVLRRLHELVTRFGDVSDGGKAQLKSPITQQDLADWAGVSRQAVVKELRQLRDDGLIQTRGSHFTFFDVKELEARVRDLGAATL